MINKFKAMYKIMGILGEVLGICGAVYALIKNIDSTNDFYFLLVALMLLLIGIRVLLIMKYKGKLKNVDEINAVIAKGHLSLMIGVCIMAAALLFANGQTFGAALAVILIIIGFMSIMLAFMIMTFNRLMDMAKESEKK